MHASKMIGVETRIGDDALIEENNRVRPRVNALEVVVDEWVASKLSLRRLPCAISVTTPIKSMFLQC